MSEKRLVQLVTIPGASLVGAGAMGFAKDAAGMGGPLNGMPVIRFGHNADIGDWLHFKFNGSIIDFPKLGDVSTSEAHYLGAEYGAGIALLSILIPMAFRAIKNRRVVE